MLACLRTVSLPDLWAALGSDANPPIHCRDEFSQMSEVLSQHFQSQVAGTKILRPY